VLPRITPSLKKRERERERNGEKSIDRGVNDIKLFTDRNALGRFIVGLATLKYVEFSRGAQKISDIRKMGRAP